MENKYSVYKLIFPNGKSYIGITGKSLYERWKNGYGYNKHMPVRKAIDYFGWENVNKECLFSNLSKNDAEQKEIELISFYKSNNRVFGYNVLPGGNLSRTNVEVSKETREKLSKVGMGHKVTDEMKKKISLKNSGINSSCYGKKLTKEHIEKIISTRIKNGLRKKKLLQIDIKTDQVINIWDSGIDVERKLGISRKHIPSVCKGKRISTGGYKWRYA